MRWHTHLLDVPAAVVLEYLGVAAVLACAGALAAGARPKSSCGVDSCAFIRFFTLVAFVAATLMLVVGLSVSIVVASVRRSRRRRYGLPDPRGSREIFRAATSASGRGLIWATAALPFLIYAWRPAHRVHHLNNACSPR